MGIFLPRSIALLSLVLALPSCGDPSTPPAPDAPATIDAGSACTRDGDCDDDLFCNGEESCESGVCTDGTAPCAAATCNEAADSCGDCEEPDGDGDGEPSIACGGSDCDDEDPTRAPGRTEVCDAADRDEDCDATTFGIRDLDADGEADAACCNTSETGTETCGEDCDDTRATVGPTAPEVCDMRDNDCNGAVDEGVLETFYPDADNDEYGAVGSTPIEACSAPPLHADNDDDCDDVRSGVNPGLGEVCDAAGLDENCDGTANPPADCMCVAGGSRPCDEPGACSSGTEMCTAGSWGSCSIAPVAETCNGIDDNCNGPIDEGTTVTCFVDADNDSYAPFGAPTSERCPDDTRPAMFARCPNGFTGRSPGAAADCNDAAAAVYPGAPELCDGTDSNCSTGGGSASDEDADGDFFGPPGAPCSGGPYPLTDCNETRSDVYPTAPELCDREDHDCSSGGGAAPDEDADSDGYASTVTMTCTGGFPHTDCLDTSNLVRPGSTTYRTTPWCRSGTATLCPGNMWVCGTCAVPSPASFDYNCNSTIDTAPVRSTCPSSGPACFVLTCTDGPNAPVTPAMCGLSTTLRSCTCGGTGCDNGGTFMGNLGCR